MTLDTTKWEGIGSSHSTKEELKTMKKDPKDLYIELFEEILSERLEDGDTQDEAYAYADANVSDAVEEHLSDYGDYLYERAKDARYE